MNIVFTSSVTGWCILHLCYMLLICPQTRYWETTGYMKDLWPRPLVVKMWPGFCTATLSPSHSYRWDTFFLLHPPFYDSHVKYLKSYSHSCSCLISALRWKVFPLCLYLVLVLVQLYEEDRTYSWPTVLTVVKQLTGDHSGACSCLACTHWDQTRAKNSVYVSILIDLCVEWGKVFVMSHWPLTFGKKVFSLTTIFHYHPYLHPPVQYLLIC